MPYAVQSGSKIVGVSKTKKGVNKVLAKQYRKENKVSVLKVKGVRKKTKRKTRKKRGRR